MPPECDIIIALVPAMDNSLDGVSVVVFDDDDQGQIGIDAIYRDVSGKDLLLQLLQSLDSTRIPKAMEAPLKIVTSLEDNKNKQNCGAQCSFGYGVRVSAYSPDYYTT